jgi:hypothetical protein
MLIKREEIRVACFNIFYILFTDLAGIDDCVKKQGSNPDKQSLSETGEMTINPGFRLSEPLYFVSFTD